MASNALESCPPEYAIKIFLQVKYFFKINRFFQLISFRQSNLVFI
jgi:hypothetical protein